MVLVLVKITGNAKSKFMFKHNCSNLHAWLNVESQSPLMSQLGLGIRFVRVEKNHAHVKSRFRSIGKSVLRKFKLVIRFGFEKNPILKEILYISIKFSIFWLF